MHVRSETSSIARQADPLSSLSTRNDSEPHIQSLAGILKMSAIPLLPRRMISIFLGREVEGIHFPLPDLMMRLMSQCLEGFIRESGGEIVHVTNFEERGESKEITPVYHVVTTAAGTFRFQNDGFVFIRLPSQRVVIELRRIHFGSDILCHAEIHTNDDARSFLLRWSDYTRQHHYLRGQAAFADGEPIIHSRRYTWDDVVLPQRIRAMLRTHVETFLTHVAQLRTVGVKGRRGLILSGPPGTGKTLVGKVLADTLGITFLWVLPRHVQSQARIGDILQAARFLAPVVIFFEDLDLFGEERGNHQTIILGELMNQLDGVSDNDGIVTIATTNRLEMVESALRNRPGRFDRVLELGLPDVKGRRKLLQRLLTDITEPELIQLAAATDQYSPAQLEEVVNTIHLLAMESGENANETGLPKMTPELINRAAAEVGDQKKHAIGFDANE